METFRTRTKLFFSQVSPQGFGDRYNSWAWSMLWWRGKLYVGTNRAWYCAERGALHNAFPLFVKYPPSDPDVECTPDLVDLPLQAEIWRWTPETDQWERVYQSSQDVPIPGRPGKYVARDIGFRDMAVFVEPDGTEAMYVSGVSARFIFRPTPPPRLLRSTDGLTFAPVPQGPGTVLGDLDKGSFRTIAVYKGRLFVLAGGISGHGVLLESSNPVGGNDHFRQVSPSGMRPFEMAPFNGYLYLGLCDQKRGYAVVRTDATDSLPYVFTPVVTAGAYLPKPSQRVISMQVFQGRLYVGTDRPAPEVIRINPDDTWDLVAGTPRETPDGWKFPISGLDVGFSSGLNGHIWRMQAYRGRLYIGTWDVSTGFRMAPGADAVLEPNYGFDLFETADGWHYSPITTTGFDDKFNYGLRSFADTPYGLFLGTANSWYGLEIWRGMPVEASLQSPETGKVGKRGWISMANQDCPEGGDVAAYHSRTALFKCPPPECLEVEHNEHKVLLSWEGPIEAERYRIWRANVTNERYQAESNPWVAWFLRIVRAILVLRPDVYFPPLPDELWVPGTYQEIGMTERSHFEDATAVAGMHYLYFARAEDREGNLSVPSNIVAVPLLTSPVTFDGLLGILDGLASRDKSQAAQVTRMIREEIDKARAHYLAEDAIGSDGLLQELCHNLEVDGPQALAPWTMEDLRFLLTKLRRRITLSQAQLIPSARLLGVRGE